MNLHTKNDKIQFLKQNILHKRDEWRIVRTDRLTRKLELLEKNIDIKHIRTDQIYRKLKKNQKRISKEIKHLERKINKLLV